GLVQQDLMWIPEDRQDRHGAAYLSHASPARQGNAAISGAPAGGAGGPAGRAARSVSVARGGRTGAAPRAAASDAEVRRAVGTRWSPVGVPGGHRRRVSRPGGRVACPRPARRRATARPPAGVAPALRAAAQVPGCAHAAPEEIAGFPLPGPRAWRARG